ncbi:helix-turn-helix domain-containing protein [Neorhizobium galegae]|uniref:helix-turn-helix domain-containing protein n=1 Tax=Neorhizobium galegae TaxID=399 RepID=UPI001AE0F0D7|nr:helix-turn-helix domain-containing protein [Neorhizobium galegae]
MTELDLLTPAEAAAMLTISVKVLREHVDAGEIAFIPKGSGKKRPRMAFDRKDILDFINRRRMRKCPPTSPKTRRITTSTSNLGVIGFMERREKLLAEKRKR